MKRTQSERQGARYGCCKMRESSPRVNVAFLEAYAAAWNARDIDRIMGAMTPDCVFETAGGNADYGVRSVSHNAVRDVDSNGHEFRRLGCDLFIFRDGKIRTKMTFLRPGIAPAI